MVFNRRMIPNIEYLTEACKRKKIPFTFIDHNCNAIQIEREGRPPLFFVNCTTPLNNEGVAKLCRDKYFTYVQLEKVVRMPQTTSFLDPVCPPEHQKYLSQKSNEEILTQIERIFEDRKIIIKRNSGAEGKHVFLCKTAENRRRAIAAIFNKNSRYYDYVALAQEYIVAAGEYRVVTLDGEIVLWYRKNTGATNEKEETKKSKDQSTDVNSEDMLKKLSFFVKPIFKRINARWAGLDIIVTADGTMYLLEINTAPGFSYFKEGEVMREQITTAYEKLLINLLA